MSTELVQLVQRTSITLKGLASDLRRGPEWDEDPSDYEARVADKLVALVDALDKQIEKEPNDSAV